MTIKLFDNEQTVTIRPASEIFASTVGFEWNKDNHELYLTFSTTENRKGYGKQKVRMSEFNQVMEVLEEAAINGIHKENETPTASEVVKRSLIEGDNGEVRFKTEAEKGKKPTVFKDFEDFQGFVSKFSEYKDAIHSKAQQIEAKRNA